MRQQKKKHGIKIVTKLTEMETLQQELSKISCDRDDEFFDKNKSLGRTNGRMSKIILFWNNKRRSHKRWEELASFEITNEVSMEDETKWVNKIRQNLKASELWSKKQRNITRKIED